LAGNACSSANDSSVRLSAISRSFVFTTVALGSCTHNDFMPNVIQLSPNGTATSPAKESINASFTLTAVEDGYTGQFTAQTVVGECWVVQSPITTGGAWIVSPEGTTCSQYDVEKIQVKDQKGNSAVTYIRGY
jgi:hypothetical protein